MVFMVLRHRRRQTPNFHDNDVYLSPKDLGAGLNFLFGSTGQADYVCFREDNEAVLSSLRI